MRIQNNITAMNTHRQYTINNDNVAKSAEKLSSGYRINRAGDDAAGLAISEKMRSQIRGLNMATKNSQDAISLVQTAEGALQETHSMLQRMNELAVQAATGTNQEEDRLALAKEFEQLKREINDVAEQTTFNNMKILDGSMSYSGFVRSVQTAGVNTTVEKLSDASAANPISASVTSATEGAAAVTGNAATFTMNSADLNKNLAELGYQDGDKIKVDFGSLGSITMTAGATNGVGAAASTTLGAAIATALGSATNGGGASTASTGTTREGDIQKWSADSFTANSGKLVLKGPDGSSGNEFKDTDLASIKPTITGGDRATSSTATVAVGPNATGQAGTITATGSATTVNFDAVTAKDATYTLKIGQGAEETKITVKGDGTQTLGQLLHGENGSLNGLGADFHLDYGTGTAQQLRLVSDDSSVDSTNFLNGKTVTVKLEITDSPAITADANTAITDGVAKADAKDATGAKSTTYIEFDETKDAHMKDGDTISVNGNNYVFGKDFSDLQGLVDAIGAKDPNVEAAVGTDADGRATLDLTQKQVTAGDITTTPANPTYSTFSSSDVSVKWTGQSGEGTKSTVEFDFAKIQVGDKFKVTIGSKDFEVEKTASDTRESFMQKITDVVGKTYDDGVGNAKVNGNAIVAEGVSVSVEMTKDGLEGKDTNAIRIQVGALENEQLAVSIDSMNTAGLKLDEHNLDTQDAAGKAITAVRNAVNKVSDQRATLGAMQNRLDHKIANLKVSSENLSAAESRIRDVDMASEMTNFTKNNILSQAATAMLAQANSLPQNVLSLLG